LRDAKREPLVTKSRCSSVDVAQKAAGMLGAGRLQRHCARRRRCVELPDLVGSGRAGMYGRSGQPPNLIKQVRLGMMRQVMRLHNGQV
jgi:hypothetical protein